MTLLGWSSIPLFLKYFAAHMDAWSSNGWRYAMAAVFWLPVLLFQRRAGEDRRGLWTAALWPSACNAVGQVAYAWIVYLQIDPGMMSFLLRAQIVFVTVGAFLLFPDERNLIRTAGFWLGLGLVILGTCGTIFLGHAPPSGTSLLGICAGLFSGAMFGLYALGVRAKMNRFSSMTSFAVISLYTSAALVGLMLVFGRRHGAVVFDLSPFRWLMLVASAMVGIALGHVFYYASIARLGVAVSSSILLIQPFITGAISWQLFDEQLTALQWVSGALGVLGAAVIIRAQSRLPALKRPSPIAAPVGVTADRPATKPHAVAQQAT